uniref:Uncharacterized protein n=1 Tax=Arundo donax TaxID=35708 RepID=A0A0A9FXX5_ARUDO
MSPGEQHPLRTSSSSPASTPKVVPTRRHRIYSKVVWLIQFAEYKDDTTALSQIHVMLIS